MSTATHAELDGTPRSARKARDLVRQFLGNHHPSADDAALAASELVANAIAHTRSGQPGGTISLIIVASAQPESVFIRVTDAGAPTAPALAAAGPDSEHGRGLAIVAAVAAQWGTETNHAGRATWCRLTPATGPAASPQPAKNTVAMHGQPRSNDLASRYDNGRPAWVAVTWVNEQLRGRIARNGAAIADMWECMPSRRNPPGRQPQAEVADREAEP